MMSQENSFTPDQQQQQVICQQPNVETQTPRLLAGDHQSTSSQQQLNCSSTTRLQANPSAQNSNSLHQIDGSSLSFVASQVQFGPNGTNLSVFNPQRFSHYPQQPQLNPTSGEPTNNYLAQIPLTFQQVNGAASVLTHNQHQHAPLTTTALVAATPKSKSCLTCADISIKWYIVVIALLGLICALIGTIIGAVHSAGRDYISLALLLIGVGLVLVAISWIALRITISTYKTNSSSDRLANVRFSLHHAHQHHQVRHNPSRVMATPRQNPGSSESQGVAALQRSLLNDRIYMMAAAAAAAAALTRPPIGPQATPSGSQQTPASTATNSTSPTIGQANGARQVTEQPEAGASFLTGFKQRLPRRLARLISENNSSPDSQLLAGPSNSRPSGDSSSMSHQNTEAQSAASLAAASAALLHQYQVASLLPPHHPTFLFAPPPPPHPHLFGLGYPPGEFPFRAPPPSYNAAMQDQRLRQILQGRVNSQHQSNGLGAVQTQAQTPADSGDQNSNGQSSNSRTESRIDFIARPREPNEEPPPDGTPIESTPTEPSPAVQRSPGTEIEWPRETSTGELNAAGENSHSIGQLIFNQVGVSLAPRLRLKSSSSTPTVASLVTNNDIYVSSESSSSRTETSRPRSEQLTRNVEPKSLLNCHSTIVNIRPSRVPTDVRTSESRAELKVLGYL